MFLAPTEILNKKVSYKTSFYFFHIFEINFFKEVKFNIYFKISYGSYKKIRLVFFQTMCIFVFLKYEGISIIPFSRLLPKVIGLDFFLEKVSQSQVMTLTFFVFRRNSAENDQSQIDLTQHLLDFL